MSHSRLFHPSPKDQPNLVPALSPLDNFLSQWTPLPDLNDPLFPTWNFPDQSCSTSNSQLPSGAPVYHWPALDFPPSPSDTCSSISTDITPSPAPDTIRVVCNVPLLAPRPLPYHSPTFLQFDLPDTDEDLSHPPYTHRPSKRKRDADEHDDSNSPAKRRAGIHRWRSRLVYRPWDSPSVTHHSHRNSGYSNHRCRP